MFGLVFWCVVIMCELVSEGSVLDWGGVDLEWKGVGVLEGK